MPKKYQIILKRDYSQSFTAHEKAPKDVVEILSRHEYQPIEIKIRENLRSLLRVPYLLWTLFVIFFRFEAKSEVFFQYPFTNVIKYFFWLFKLKKIRLRVLIHDLESLRYEGKISQQEIVCLSRFDGIIALTDSMKDLLIQKGIDQIKIKVLHIWDYLLKSKVEAVQEFGYTICFAGNLYKSEFVNKLEFIKSSRLTFVLYGTIPTNVNLFGRKVLYGGLFSPEDPSTLNGNWGLVWDGTETYSCEGALGQYLRYNTSHKLGLYLAKGIPVIVWSQSAVAGYIAKKQLGLVVNSLCEVETKIENLEKEAYAEILENVSIFSRKVRHGKMLGALLN